MAPNSETSGTSGTAPSPESVARPRPPVPKRVSTERVHHGDVYIDDFAWLADRENPDVRAYLEGQNAYTEALTSDQAATREAVYAEIKAHTQETDMSVPMRRGGYWYYSRTVEGSQYPISCRAPVAGPDDWDAPVLPAADATAPGLPGEAVLLDYNDEAEGHEFFSVGVATVSPDGRLLAYSVDTAGDERFTLRIRDIASGEQVGRAIEDVHYGAEWAPDGRFLFYVRADEAWRPDSVWRHDLQSDADDVLVFREPDEKFSVGVRATRSRRFLVIEAASKLTSEVLVLDGGDPEGEFRVVLPREEGVEYEIEHAVLGGEDRYLVLHNRSGVNFELASVPVDEADDPSAWTVLVPHRDDVRLEYVDAFARTVVLGYRRAGLPRLAMTGTDSTAPRFEEWQPGEELATVSPGSNPEWDSPRLRLGFESFITPTTLLEVDLDSGESRVLKRKTVRDFDVDAYEQAREWVTARDGTSIPVSIVRRRRGRDAIGKDHAGADGGGAEGAGADGTGPVLLYGYGSYEACMDPWFSIPRLSLLDRGVTFAVAHVRGGGEMGRLWYDDGKMLAKKNTFTDFVDVARHLVATGATTARQLVASGGSAGGLLMGAVANLAPELFAGIVADVPFVDPLTSVLDPSLPLTVTEWDEWGDPLHDPDVYRYMKSYSPYENVSAQPYPAILAITSLNDTRVLYTEPAKWVAALQAATTSDEPVLLRTEMSAGHGGVSGRYAQWREVAFEYAWVLHRLGCVPSAPRDH